MHKPAMEWTPRGAHKAHHLEFLAAQILISLLLIQKVGKGGPTYADPAFTGESFWDDSGKLKRRQLLDSYTQHTQKCRACSKV